MSFVSYSLCSLSFLSQTPVLLHCAQRCAHSSIPAVKPTLIRQSRVPSEWPAKSLCPLFSPSPFCAQRFSLSSSTGSVSPCSDHCARPSPTAETMICNERDSRGMGNSLLLLPQLLIFLWNRLHQPTFCRVGLLKTTTATKPPKPPCVLWQPNRLAQTENGIDRFGKGQTQTLMQTDAGGFFSLNLSLLNTVQHTILYLQRKAFGGWRQRLIPL